jgi:hypothetical protein
MRVLMTAVPVLRTDVSSFRVAHPVVRRTSRIEITSVAVLSFTALALWLVVLPVEFAHGVIA